MSEADKAPCKRIELHCHHYALNDLFALKMQNFFGDSGSASSVDSTGKYNWRLSQIDMLVAS